MPSSLVVSSAMATSFFASALATACMARCTEERGIPDPAADGADAEAEFHKVVNDDPATNRFSERPRGCHDWSPRVNWSPRVPIGADVAALSVAVRLGADGVPAGVPDRLRRYTIAPGRR